jgi:hypothetical protein
MKLTQALQDTVYLMEGGRVYRARRPGERFVALEADRRARPRPKARFAQLLTALVKVQG